MMIGMKIVKASIDTSGLKSILPSFLLLDSHWRQYWPLQIVTLPMFIDLPLQIQICGLSEILASYISFYVSLIFFPGLFLNYHQHHGGISTIINHNYWNISFMLRMLKRQMPYFWPTTFWCWDYMWGYWICLLWVYWTNFQGRPSVIWAGWIRGSPEFLSHLNEKTNSLLTTEKISHFATKIFFLWHLKIIPVKISLIMTENILEIHLFIVFYLWLSEKWKCRLLV